MGEEWLSKFKQFWLEKDIESILWLFTEDFIYYETPYQKITDKEILKNEWNYINNHEIEHLSLEIFSEQGNKMSVKFEYKYIFSWEEKQFSWVYLIELDNWKCNYFFQVWE
jgi:hypothetical protein